METLINRLSIRILIIVLLGAIVSASYLDNLGR